MADKTKSAILIEFDDYCDVRFVPQYLGDVHPGQIIFACEMLMVLAKQQILEANVQAAEKKKPKIATPKTVFAREQ